MLKQGLAEKFPQFFADEEEVNISIPVGWSAFAATGLEVTLASVCLRGNTLCAVEAESGTSRMRRSESGATRFLNSLLRRSKAICALCGVPVTAGGCRAASHTAGELPRPPGTCAPGWRGLPFPTCKRLGGCPRKSRGGAPGKFFYVPDTVDGTSIISKMLQVKRCAVHGEAGGAPGGRIRRGLCQPARAAREKAKHGCLI